MIDGSGPCQAPLSWHGPIDYELPPELIAQHPAAERDQSRLMIVDRRAQTITDASFADLGQWLRAGDLLVANDSRVMTSRLHGRKPSGGRIELLVLARGRGPVPAMFKASKPPHEGQGLTFDGGYSARIVGPVAQGRCRVDFGKVAVDEVLAAIGSIPLPPYIDRDGGPEPADSERYQTVYARHSGSVAAPTAGLHFTPTLLTELEEQGVGFARVTLHVGPGTFTPVRGSIEQHVMEAERCTLDASTAEQIRASRGAGGRIVAVGTTSVRVLESAADEDGEIGRFSGATELFIRPGYRFRSVDVLLTNFHLPGSTLLCLVMAFGGERLLRQAYELAVAKRYRFYSYGDAMLIV